MCKDARVPIRHCDTPRIRIETLGICLMRDEANITAPCRGPWVESPPLGENLVSMVEIAQWTYLSALEQPHLGLLLTWSQHDPPLVQVHTNCWSSDSSCYIPKARGENGHSTLSNIVMDAKIHSGGIGPCKEAGVQEDWAINSSDSQMPWRFWAVCSSMANPLTDLTAIQTELSSLWANFDSI